MSALKPSELPGWPRLLSADLAAAYTGRSVELFEEEVRQGRWPKPQQKGFGTRRISRVWDRSEIDSTIDRARERFGANMATGYNPRSEQQMLEDLTNGLAKGRKGPKRA